MNTAIKLWLGMRAIRWLAWIALAVVSLHYIYFPARHLTQFGHLQLWSETLMFGTSLFATFAGMFELALRGRAGLAAPKPFHLMPPMATGPITPIR